MTLEDIRFALTQTLAEMGTNFMTNMWIWSRPAAPSDARLNGRTVIVTGSNRTIGKAVAEDLSCRGARVILACRNVALAEAAADDIRTRVPNAVLICHKLDLSSLNSIEAFVERVTKTEKVDMLINNAGMVTNVGRQETADGYEMMFGINFLGTAYLSLLMLPHLQSSPDARIIFVASLTHANVADVQWDDLQSVNKKSDPFTNMDTYGHSKLCLLLFIRKFAVVAHKKGVNVYACDPGISPTDIIRETPLSFRIIHKILLPFYCQRSVNEAASSVLAPALFERNGYSPDEYHFCDGTAAPVSRIARDDERAEKLWNIMAYMVKMQDL